MTAFNTYTKLWEKYRPAIVTKMRLALVEPQEYSLTRHEFETLGGKSSAGNRFHLEIVNGAPSTSIGITPVAKDLFDVLAKSPSAKQLLEESTFKIALSSKYILKIESTGSAVTTDTPEDKDQDA